MISVVVVVVAQHIVRQYGYTLCWVCDVQAKMLRHEHLCSQRQAWRAKERHGAKVRAAIATYGFEQMYWMDGLLKGSK